MLAAFVVRAVWVAWAVPLDATPQATMSFIRDYVAEVSRDLTRIVLKVESIDETIGGIESQTKISAQHLRYLESHFRVEHLGGNE